MLSDTPGASSSVPLLEKLSPIFRVSFLGCTTVFSSIFPVEYVLTGLAYVAVGAGWWPPSFPEAAPPARLPVTVAIFGLFVHVISFIPVIRQITSLPEPYFVTSERVDVQLAT